MIELILAIGKDNELGYKNSLPWKCTEEMAIFKEKTLNCVLIVGRKTAEYLPYLRDRKIVCLTKKNPDTSSWKNEVSIINSLEDINVDEGTKIIAGGMEIYKLALSKANFVSKIHLSIMKKKYKADTFFDIKLLHNYVITNHQNYEEFDHFVLEKTINGEGQYIKMLENVLENGDSRQTRNGYTKSSFCNHFTFDLQNGFPLLTTKKMFLRGIIQEFLFFFRGDTNTKILHEENIHIWDGNTSAEFIKSMNLPYAERVMGPMYGYQWRNFGAPYILNKKGEPVKNKEGIDQINNVINLIKNDPTSRRILLTTYNPSQAEEGVLYPCHSIIIQFYVEGCFLDMFCYNRSQDAFLGVPYNIASSSLLLMFIAKFTDKIPRYLNITMGDTHIYESHIIQAKEQISRIPYKFPKLHIPDVNELSDINNINYEDFFLENYDFHPSINVKMVI
jgi:dihydrofolate reductase / thymidylate synthase